MELKVAGNRFFRTQAENINYCENINIFFDQFVELAIVEIFVRFKKKLFTDLKIVYFEKRVFMSENEYGGKFDNLIEPNGNTVCTTGRFNA